MGKGAKPQPPPDPPPPVRAAGPEKAAAEAEQRIREGKRYDFDDTLVAGLSAPAGRPNLG